MTEPTLEESIQQVLPTLPPSVQDFFQQGKLGETARRLTERYMLHIDQGAILERELMAALLGVKGPDEIAEALYEDLPISKQTVQDIIADLNKEIFVPLREEMRKGGNIPAVPQARVNTPAPNYSAPRPQVANPTIAPLPPKMVMPPASPALGLPKGSDIPKESMPINIPPRRTLINLIQKPIESSDKLLEDHEEPHIELKTAETPLRQALRTVLPPDNLPGAIFHPELPKPPMPPIAPLKSYSTDPYHEPLDEK